MLITICIPYLFFPTYDFPLSSKIDLEAEYIFLGVLELF